MAQIWNKIGFWKTPRIQKWEEWIQICKFNTGMTLLPENHYVSISGPLLTVIFNCRLVLQFFFFFLLLASNSPHTKFHHLKIFCVLLWLLPTQIKTNIRLLQKPTLLCSSKKARWSYLICEYDTDVCDSECIAGCSGLSTSVRDVGTWAVGVVDICWASMWCCVHHLTSWHHTLLTLI